MTKFSDLGFSEPLNKAIDDAGYDTPTPIQAEAIPHILMMRDVIGIAQTGTGKTASFTLPLVEILHDGRAKARMPRCLILSPTRELASQIAENFDKYGKYASLSKALLVGGSTMTEQIKLLERGVDVLIATPGRLMDLFERGRILLTDIKIFVIDEADRMLDMGFIPDIESIVSKLPSSRQTLLFSATMPPEIEKLAQKFMDNPRTVSVAPPASTAATVTQKLVNVAPRQKQARLIQLIKSENVKNAYIFCNTKRMVDTLAKKLKSEKLNAAAIHGDMAQSARYETLADFKSGKITLLVCSDVAARGLDIPDVSHVFNFDLPSNPDDYVHRIGRTGRAGKEGCAWSFATDNDDKLLQGIEKQINKKIPVADTKPSREEKRTARPQPQKEKRSTENKKSVKYDYDTDLNSNQKGFGDEMPAFFGAGKS